MNAMEIPLSSINQTSFITLGNGSYTLRVIWRDVAGWIMDVIGSDGVDILSGVPLIPGIDLLEQYPELGISGSLVMLCDREAPEYPTETNLGVFSHLYFVQE